MSVTEDAEAAKIAPNSSGKKELIKQSLRELLPAIKIATISIPLSLFDLATDVKWTTSYLTSSVTLVNVVGTLLLIALLIHNSVSSYYGLSYLRF